MIAMMCSPFAFVLYATRSLFMPLLFTSAWTTSMRGSFRMLVETWTENPQPGRGRPARGPSGGGRLRREPSW